MTTTNIDYFESDQIKFALELWKFAKKSHAPDFDVLKFTHHWSYADSVLHQLMLSDDALTSQHAIELMQLRILFAQKFPERAKKMGLSLNASSVAVDAITPTKNSPYQSSTDTKPTSESPTPPDKRYVKGVR